MTGWITDTSIRQRLKFIRRFRRLTQKELGLLMGYSEKTADVRIAPQIMILSPPIPSVRKR